MNEAGVLGRFIPDFGRVVGMMQFSMYHHYTVDEHLIRAVGELSAIEAGRLAEDLPLATKIMPQIAHRTELYLATFLHDIAKGRGTDHSLAGRRSRAQAWPAARPHRPPTPSASRGSSSSIWSCPTWRRAATCSIRERRRRCRRSCRRKSA